MKYTILGCGSSTGTPQIGCSCVVCKSQNPKNYRTRPSLLVEVAETKILVDTTPDLRSQALNNDLHYVDAVLYTHAHADHIMGIDELKLLSKDGKPIPCYADQHTANALEQKFAYTIEQQHPLYPKKIDLRVVKPYENLIICGISILPFLQEHAGICSLGFRFGKLAYSTDVENLSTKSFEALKGVEIWIVDCHRYHAAPSHGCLELIIHWMARIKPRLTIFTHMSHGMEYDEMRAFLPANIIPAYDGMVIFEE